MQNKKVCYSSFFEINKSHAISYLTQKIQKGQGFSQALYFWNQSQLQCDQVPKPENRQVFAKNSHVWRVDFQPPIFPAPFPAPVINVYFKYYFYLIYAILWLQTFDTMIIY